MSLGKDVETPRRLLVVDDEADICDLVRFAAENVGYVVSSTSNVEEFPVLYSNDLDVIVLDLMMPGIDGIELIRFLGDNRSPAALVLMSGFDRHVLSSAQELAAGRGLHVIGALNKPISIDALETLLKGATRSAAGRATSGQGPSLSIADLERAIADRLIVPHCQPKLDFKSRRLVGVEQLARWHDPLLGAIPPWAFVPLAEENGLIDNLTRLVINSSLVQARYWRGAGIECSVAINLSAKNLVDLEFPDGLLEKTTRHGILPKDVVIEITESAIPDDIGRSLDILTRLRMKGFRLSIDDFGTGRSTMERLKKAPFTELKIDRSFVAEAVYSEGARAIVETTIELGHKLDMRVVAEGIEDEATWRLMAEMGCDEAQGYFIARPMPHDELPGWVAASPLVVR